MTSARSRRRTAGLACMAALAALWLLAVSHVHVNASWSDDAWGYLILPLGKPEAGDLVLFEPPAAVGSPVPYLKTVRGVPGDRVAVYSDRRVWVGGTPLGRVKIHALDGRPLEAAMPGMIPEGRVWTPPVMQALSSDGFSACGQVLSCVRPHHCGISHAASQYGDARIRSKIATLSLEARSPALVFPIPSR